MVGLRVLLLLGILRFLQGRVIVYTEVHAWRGSDAVLKCSLRLDMTDKEVTQVTWERNENGRSVAFLTYSSASSVQKLDAFAERRVDYLGDRPTEGSIRIRDVALSDERVYTCIFTMFPEQASPTSNMTTLIVQAKPDIQVKLLPDPVVARLPYQTVATCVAGAAKPAANITWGTDGLDYKSSEQKLPHENRTVTTQSELSMIPGAGIKDRSVRCIVSQNNGTSNIQTERLLTIQNVQYPPESVLVEVRTLESGALQFTCLDDSSPPATSFTWRRMDTYDSHEAVELGSGRNLSIEYFPSGLYICEVTNDIGKARGYLYFYRQPGSSACLHGCLWPVLILAVAFVVYVFRSKIRPCLGKTEEAQFRSAEQDDSDPIGFR